MYTNKIIYLKPTLNIREHRQTRNCNKFLRDITNVKIICNDSYIKLQFFQNYNFKEKKNSFFA